MCEPVPGGCGDGGGGSRIKMSIDVLFTSFNAAVGDDGLRSGNCAGLVGDCVDVSSATITIGSPLLRGAQPSATMAISMSATTTKVAWWCSRRQLRCHRRGSCEQRPRRWRPPRPLGLPCERELPQTRHGCLRSCCRSYGSCLWRRHGQQLWERAVCSSVDGRRSSSHTERWRFWVVTGLVGCKAPGS